MRRLALCLLVIAPLTLGAQDTGWEITSFDVTYQVNRNRTIDVVERIAVDFGRLQRHGIYREIPVRYKRVARAGIDLEAGRMSVDLDLGGVTDAEGNSLETSTERGDRVRIRIGNGDRYVTGKQLYVIMYRLGAGGIGFFPEHDELYWQVTGTEWPVPIRSATARVVLPAGGDVSDSAWTAWCYAGWSDSNSNARCTAEVSPTVEYRFATGRLDPYEGLTMVAGFPKGIVPAPTPAEVAAERIAIWWPAALPFLIFFAMFWLWYTRGREPHVGSIVPQWKPSKDMRPGTAGTLRDQSADMDDIVATLLDFAVRGYLTIHEVQPKNLFHDLSQDSFIGKALKSLGAGKTDWSLERTEKPDGDLLPYERAVLEHVFEGSTKRQVTDLHNDFYKYITGIKSKMYEQVVAQGWFVENPLNVRSRWIIIGVLALLAGVAGAAVLSNFVLAVGAGLSGVIIIAFANAMPAMTAAGARRWAEVKGLEEYIRRAEKLELELRQAPKRTTELFETLLPYAVALNATDIWVDHFASALASQPPSWYVGSQMGLFNVTSFRSSLGDFSTAASRTMGSSPGSSSGGGGGGSVGGGGGGGGGGSW